MLLAGVTISLMQGNSGIISKADESKNSSKRSELIERAKIKVSDKSSKQRRNTINKRWIKRDIRKLFYRSSCKL